MVKLLGRNELVKDYGSREISERITYIYMYIKYYTVILILGIYR